MAAARAQIIAFIVAIGISSNAWACPDPPCEIPAPRPKTIESPDGLNTPDAGYSVPVIFTHPK